MSLLGLIKPRGKSGFGYSSTAEEVTSGISLEGKNVLVTGCNSGLGKETSRVLSMRGARILGTARTKEKADEACSQFGKNSVGFACDLSNPASVHSFVETVKRGEKKIDVVICNAGIMAIPKPEKAFGFELQFFTNHIGHFILVTGLLDKLSEEGRVIMLSSSAHSMAPPEGIQFDNLGGDKNYKPWTAYGQSKMANLLFAKELARRFQGTGKTANAIHPGVIRTNLGRHMSPAANVAFAMVQPLFLKSVHQGAATSCYAAVHPQMSGISGEYLADCNIAKYRADADNEELARKLWSVSEEIVSSLM